MIQGIGNGNDGNSLTGIAEHLRAGHHYDVIVGILCNCRLERRLERLAKRLTEVHAHICKVFNDDGVIFRSKLTDCLQFILGQIEPRRIVRAGIDDRRYTASRQMTLQFRPKLVATEIIYVERITRNAEDLRLGTLHRKSGIDEKNGVTSLYKMGAEQEGREAALHGSDCRDTPERGHINVKICLKETGSLFFQFRDAVHVGILGRHSGIKCLLLCLDAHTHGRKSGYAHFKMKELGAALSLQSLCDSARLPDSRAGNVQDVHLLQ